MSSFLFISIAKLYLTSNYIPLQLIFQELILLFFVLFSTFVKNIDIFIARAIINTEKQKGASDATSV